MTLCDWILRGCAVVMLLSASRWSAAQDAAPANGVDRFGVQMLAPTAPGGREWFADWTAQRSVPRFKADPLDPLLKNSAGTLEIGAGVATLPSERTRLYVMTPKDQSGTYTADPWRNVEMTCYFRAGPKTQDVPGQAITLSARSGEKHNDTAPCDGTSYHASQRLDGQCGFKKEVWHGEGGYSDLRPNPAPKPWDTVPVGRWIGMKFLCRNCDQGQHIRLQLYVDAEESGKWQPLAEVTDAGGWNCEREACDRPRDFIISEGRPAVYFRTDFVPIEVTKFSVREVEALP